MALTLKTKKGATMRHATTATDNVTKEVVHHEEGERNLPNEAKGDRVAMIRVVDSVKLSYNYNSIGVEVGLDLPWEIQDGPLPEQVKKGFDTAHKLVEDELGEKAMGLRDLLTKLSNRR